MVGMQDISQWRGQEVVDRDDEKLGKLEDVYVDVTTDEPAFGAVKLGFIGHHRLAFVPLSGATAGQDHVKVTASKDLVKDAPAIEPGGELSADAESGIYAHYGLPYAAAETAGGRRLGRR